MKSTHPEVHIGLGIRLIRTAKGVSGKSLAMAFGCSQNALIRIEKGEFLGIQNQDDDDKVIRYAELLGVSVAQLEGASHYSAQFLHPRSHKPDNALQAHTASLSYPEPDAGTAIRVLRLVKKLSSQDLTEALNTSPRALRNFYNKKDLSLSLCYTFAKLFSISVEQLIAIAEFCGQTHIQELKKRSKTHHTSLIYFVPGVVTRVETLLATLRPQAA